MKPFRLLTTYDYKFDYTLMMALKDAKKRPKKYQYTIM